MKSHISRYTRKLVRWLAADIIRRSETNIMLAAGLHIERIKHDKNISAFSDVEFKAFSQWGEDGIIQYLIHRVPIQDRSFIEFGVEDYTESNTRFLLVNDRWRGLVLDSSNHNIDHIRNDEIHWKHNLTAECHFVSRENINEILKNAGFIGDVGLLSIDIDGNDYWIWEAIDVVAPRIVVCEYNSIFGSEHAVTIPYEECFKRSEAHFSHLYYGASLAALCRLAEQKGYDFVGSNSAGVNAFFVRRDLPHGLKVQSAADGYVASGIRESRDQSGKLSYLSRVDQLACIKEQPVYDVRNDKTILIRNII